MGRRARYRESRPCRNRSRTIWVFCEGYAKKADRNHNSTEVWYLNECKSPAVSVKVNPTGLNAPSLVKHAQSAIQHSKITPDEVWIVFDKDNLSDDQFLQTVQEAEENKYRIAYSIECFEVWLLLHFKRIEANDIRNAKYRAEQLENCIRDIIGDRTYKYDKTHNLFQKLYVNRVSVALDNADELSRLYGDAVPIVRKTPHTSIPELIRQIRSA